MSMPATTPAPMECRIPPTASRLASKACVASRARNKAGSPLSHIESSFPMATMWK